MKVVSMMFSIVSLSETDNSETEISIPIYGLSAVDTDRAALTFDLHGQYFA